MNIYIIHKNHHCLGVCTHAGGALAIHTKRRFRAIFLAAHHHQTFAIGQLAMHHANLAIDNIAIDFQAQLKAECIT